MEILRQERSSKTVSWPVTSGRGLLSIAITAAAALVQASGDQTPRSQAERKVHDQKTISRNRFSTTSTGLKGSLLRRLSWFSHNELLVKRIVRAGLEAFVEATKWPA